MAGEVVSDSEIEKGLKQILSPERADGEDCPEALLLFRVGAGDATGEEAQVFQSHLSTCGTCRRDLAAFRAAELSAPPAFAGWLPTLRLRWILAGLATVLLLGLGSWWLGRETVLPASESVFRIKGDHRLAIAVQRGDRRFVAASGDVFETGDVLGFFYTAPSDCWLVVLFTDERGRITRVFPSRSLFPARVPAGVEQPLPDGAVLEDGTGYEWIVAFFSEQALDVEGLEASLRKAVENRGPDGQLGSFELPAAQFHVIVMKRGKE